LTEFESLYAHLPKRNGNQDLIDWRDCKHVLKLDLQTAEPEVVRSAFEAQFYLSRFPYVLIFSGLRRSISYVPRAVLCYAFDDLCPAAKPYYIFGVENNTIRMDSLVEYDGWRWVFGSERAHDLCNSAEGLG